MKKEKQKVLLEIVESFNRSNDAVIRKTEEDGSVAYYHRLEPGRGGELGGKISTNKAFRRYLQTDAEKVKNLYRKAKGAEIIKFEPAKKVPKDFGTS